jgi:hypothetical protein
VLARAAGRGATVLPLSGVSGQGVPEVVAALFAAIAAARDEEYHTALQGGEGGAHHAVMGG